MDISRLGLTDLRSAIAVIPQGQIQNMSGLHRCRRVQRIFIIGRGGGGDVKISKVTRLFTSSSAESGLFTPQRGEKCVLLHYSIEKFVKMLKC